VAIFYKITNSRGPHWLFLSGRLAGLHACSAGYDCRVVFAKEKHPKTAVEALLLINIGSHEEVC
jgi:mRNA-degrading endonuclease YafQ of YafQ-DinJ toxin-antitoxin module